LVCFPKAGVRAFVEDALSTVCWEWSFCEAVGEQRPVHSQAESKMLFLEGDWLRGTAAASAGRQWCCLGKTEPRSVFLLFRSSNPSYQACAFLCYSVKVNCAEGDHTDTHEQMDVEFCTGELQEVISLASGEDQLNTKFTCKCIKEWDFVLSFRQ